MNDFNLLCVDLAGLRPIERRFLRLHVEYGLTADELADVFQVPSAVSGRVLREARRKYLQCSTRVRW